MPSLLTPPKSKFTEHVFTKCIFGCGILNDLHTYELPGKKAMICTTGEPFYDTLGYNARLTGQLDMAGIQWVIFDGVRPNPAKEIIMDGGEFARRNQVDFLISFGGGGCHDASKAISVAATNPGEIWDYISDGTGKGKPIANEPLPVVSITMTAGTGSEMNAGAVINNHETNEKLSLKGPNLFPRLCVVDPELMVSVPPKGTAMMGFDAMTHALEAYFSKNANYMTDVYALAAIEHIYAFLPRAVANGKDIEAREHVAIGANLAGRAMLHGALGMHAMEHAMSGYYPKLPHGLGLAITFRAYYSKLIAAHETDDRFIRMAQAMGKTNTQDPMDFIVAMDELFEAIGLADVKMSEFDITPDDFPRFIEAAHLMERLMLQERPMLSDQDWLEVLQQSYK